MSPHLVRNSYTPTHLVAMCTCGWTRRARKAEDYSHIGRIADAVSKHLRDTRKR